MMRLNPMPDKQAGQAQGQLANSLCQRNRKRCVSGQAEQRPEQHEAAFLRSERARHDEGCRTHAGCEAFQDECLQEAKGQAQGLHCQPNLACAGAPSDETEHDRAQDGWPTAVCRHNGLIDRRCTGTKRGWPRLRHDAVRQFCEPDKQPAMLEQNESADPGTEDGHGGEHRAGHHENDAFR
jgi:hypothetical protein